MLSRRTATATLLVSPLVSRLSGQNGAVIGSIMAPIKVEVFSDFECGHCKQLHETTMKELKNDLVQKSKVQVILHDFPLPQHKYARDAAYYACAAGKVGKREAVGDALFKEQAGWSANGKLEEVVAKALTPDEMKKVKVFVKDPTIRAQVDADIALGKQNNVNQTPTLIISGKGQRTPVPGVVTYAILKRYLETLL